MGIDMAEQRSTIELLPFPRDDAGFCREVNEQLAKASLDRPPDPGDLETRLRREYPHATVRPRMALAALDPKIETWYVYRDGTAAPRPT